MQEEFVMIKPDGVQRNLVGEIISRLEKVGLKIIAMKLLKVTKEQAKQHYAVHKGKPFYEGLLEYITSGVVVAMIVKGKDAVKITRKIVGCTNPIDALPGTIRGDLALQIGRNIIHAADSPENAKKEAAIYFTKDELIDYIRVDEKWIYE